jgi:hypothetical protein
LNSSSILPEHCIIESKEDGLVVISPIKQTDDSLPIIFVNGNMLSEEKQLFQVNISIFFFIQNLAKF